MKRSLNSSGLDIGSDLADDAEPRPAETEAARETQGPQGELGSAQWANVASPYARRAESHRVDSNCERHGRQRRSGGRGRARHNRRTDPWESYVLENWVPTLERTFGAEWQQHCPGEVAALMWWAIATRADFPQDVTDAQSPLSAAGPSGQAGSPGGYNSPEPESSPQTAPEAVQAAQPQSHAPAQGARCLALPLHALLLLGTGKELQQRGYVTVNGAPQSSSTGGSNNSPGNRTHTQRLVLLSPPAASTISGTGAADAVSVSSDCVTSTASDQQLPKRAGTVLAAGAAGLGRREGLLLLALPNNDDARGVELPRSDAGGDGGYSTSDAAGRDVVGAAVAAPSPRDGANDSGGSLFRILQQGLEARLAVSSGAAAASPRGGVSSSNADNTAAPTAGAGAAAGQVAPNSGLGSGRTLPVLDLSRPPPGQACGRESAPMWVSSGPGRDPSEPVQRRDAAEKDSKNGATAGSGTAGSPYLLDLRASLLTGALDGASLRALLDTGDTSSAGSPRGEACAGVGDGSGGGYPAAAGPDRAPAASWPRGADDASALAEAAPGATRSYEMQLPDGTVIPVQLVPLNLPSAGGTGSAAAAAAALGLGDEELVSLLLGDVGGNGGPLAEALNRSDRRGRLPLHAAAATGRAEVVERLLALGCDVAARLQQDFLRDGGGRERVARPSSQFDGGCDSGCSSSESGGDDTVYDSPGCNRAPPGSRLPRRGGRASGVSAATMPACSLAEAGPETEPEGEVGSVSSGGSSFTDDSVDTGFGGEDGALPPLSVAQAARLGLQIALDTCGDRLTPGQLHFLAGKFAEQQLWKPGPAPPPATAAEHEACPFTASDALGSAAVPPHDSAPGGDAGGAPLQPDLGQGRQQYAGAAGGSERPAMEGEIDADETISPGSQMSRASNSESGPASRSQRRGEAADWHVGPGAAQKRRQRRLLAASRPQSAHSAQAMPYWSARQSAGGAAGGGQKRPADGDALDGSALDDEQVSVGLDGGSKGVSGESADGSGDGSAAQGYEGSGQGARPLRTASARSGGEQQPEPRQRAAERGARVEAMRNGFGGSGNEGVRGPEAGSDDSSASDDGSDCPPRKLPPQLSLPAGLGLDGLRPRRRQRTALPAFVARPSYVGATPLHLAAAHGHVGVVEQLLPVPGCDPGATTDEGRTALHLAARNGHQGVVSLLLRAVATAQAGAGGGAGAASGAGLGGGGGGGLVDSADSGGHTALHLAAALGHWRVVEELWPRGASVDPVDQAGRTPLHYAALGGHVETVGRLVIGGAAVHRVDGEGCTPAHLAAMRGHAEVLEKLLLAGFEVDRRGGPPDGQQADPVLCAGASSLSPSPASPTSSGGQQQQQQPCGRGSGAAGLGTNGAPGGGGRTALHLAAAGGHCAAMAVLLQAGAGPGVRDHRGRTALHAAAGGGHRGAFELLLMHGADPRDTDHNGASALHSAARGGNLAIVERLLQLAAAEQRAGAASAAHADTARSEASSACNGGVGKEVPQQEADCAPDGKCDGDGLRGGTPGQESGVSTAQRPTSSTWVPHDCGNEETSSPEAGRAGGGQRPAQLGDGQGRRSGESTLGRRRLLDPAAPDLVGQLPLHWAASAGHAEVVARLLRQGPWRGGDPLAQDTSGATPWHLAATVGHVDVLRVLMAARSPERGCGPAPAAMPEAQSAEESSAAHPPAVTEPVDVDARDGSGRTALHCAAAGGAASVVELLLSAGADPAAVCGGCRTPLHYAAEAGLVGLVRLLLQHLPPGGVDRMDAAGWTALHHAARRGDGPMMRMLLSAGASPHSATARGWTAAHLAAREHPGPGGELLELLLGAGADPRVADADGATPLHFAALRGDEALFGRLLEAAVLAEAADQSAEKGAEDRTEAEAEEGSQSGGAGATEAVAGMGSAVPLPLPPSLFRRDLRGYTLLHYAVEGGNVATIARLLASGLAEAALEAPTAPEGPGSTSPAAPAAAPEAYLGVGLPSSILAEAPLQQRPSKALPSVSSDVSPRSAPLGALHLAAKLCQPEVVEQLLAAGYSAAARTVSTAQTPLHCAAMGPAALAPLRDDVACAAPALPSPAPPMHCRSAAAPSGAASANAAAAGAAALHVRQMMVVDALLAAGATPRAIDAFGCSPLSYAAGSGNPALVARLLAAGCDPLHADSRGLTPLHWGAAGGSAEVVTALLAAGTASGGADTDEAPAALTTHRLTAVDMYGRMPLHWAAERGAADCVAILAAAMLAAAGPTAANMPAPVSPASSAAGPPSPSTAAAAAAAIPPPPSLPELLHVADGRGCSAVQLAAAGGHVEVVARLLEAGTARGSGSGEGPAPSALHLAAQHGLEQVAAQLCGAAGCDVNARDADGLTPLHAAATRGSDAIARSLLAAGADPNIASATEGLLPLHSAAAGGHLGVVEALLEAGSLVSYKSGGGATPLHAAAGAGHVAVCEVLLEAGCPVTGRLASGASVLYCAASGGWLDVCALLLRSGAEVDAATTTGCTALHAAASNGHDKVVSLLLAEGADPDTQSSNGHTPLHNAVSGGHAAAVEALLGGGADVDVQNTNGNTPLHIASSKGYLDLVSRLLSAGSELHIRNGKGWCAVHSAASNGYFDVVLRLVQAGANWRRQGEADVVKLVTRKTTLKPSYVEGRLRLAERERHRNHHGQNIQHSPSLPGSVADGAAAGPGGAGTGDGAPKAAAARGGAPLSGRPGPDAASFEDLAAAADANMAALLEEEAAAAAAAAERKAKQQKGKKAGKASGKAVLSPVPADTAPSGTTAVDQEDAAADAAGEDAASAGGRIAANRGGNAASEEPPSKAPSTPALALDGGDGGKASRQRAGGGAAREGSARPPAAPEARAASAERSSPADPASKSPKAQASGGDGGGAAAAAVKSLSLDSSEAVSSAGVGSVARPSATAAAAPQKLGLGSTPTATGTKPKARAAAAAASDASVSPKAPMAIAAASTPTAALKSPGKKAPGPPPAVPAGSVSPPVKQHRSSAQLQAQVREQRSGVKAPAAAHGQEPARGSAAPVVATPQKAGSSAADSTSRVAAGSKAAVAAAKPGSKVASGVESPGPRPAAAAAARGRSVAPDDAGAAQAQAPQPQAWGAKGGQVPVTLAQVVAGAAGGAGKPGGGAAHAAAAQPPHHSLVSPTRSRSATGMAKRAWPPLSGKDAAQAPTSAPASQPAAARAVAHQEQSQPKPQPAAPSATSSTAAPQGHAVPVQPQTHPHGQAQQPQPRPLQLHSRPDAQGPQAMATGWWGSAPPGSGSGQRAASPIADSLYQPSPGLAQTPSSVSAGVPQPASGTSAASPVPDGHYGLPHPHSISSLHASLPESPAAGAGAGVGVALGTARGASSSPFGTMTVLASATSERGPSASASGGGRAPLPSRLTASLPVSPLRAHGGLPPLPPGLPPQMPLDLSLVALGAGSGAGGALMAAPAMAPGQQSVAPPPSFGHLGPPVAPGPHTPLLGSSPMGPPPSAVPLMPGLAAAVGPPPPSQYMPTGGLGLRSGSGPVMPTGGLGGFGGSGATWGAVCAINAAGDSGCDPAGLDGFGPLPGLSSSAPPNRRLGPQHGTPPPGAGGAASAGSSSGMYDLNWGRVWGGGIGGAGAPGFGGVSGFGGGGFFRTSSMASLQSAADAVDGPGAAPEGSPPRVSSTSSLSATPGAAAAVPLAGGHNIWAFQPSDGPGGATASAFSPLSKLVGGGSGATTAGCAREGGGDPTPGGPNTTPRQGNPRASGAGAGSAAAVAKGSPPMVSDGAAGSGPGAGSSFSQFHCPLTRQVMADPVVAADGCTYERAAIEAWLRSAPAGRAVSPVTGEALASWEVVPNFTMRAAIQLLARQ